MWSQSRCTIDCNRQILQFSELWHFLFVTSRLVTANVSPWSLWESLCHQRLTYIQYSRYVYETVTLPPFCTFLYCICPQIGEFAPTVHLSSLTRVRSMRRRPWRRRLRWRGHGGLTSECKSTMAVLTPTQPSYLRMAELATVQPHPSARWLQHTHGSHP